MGGEGSVLSHNSSSKRFPIKAREEVISFSNVPRKGGITESNFSATGNNSLIHATQLTNGLSRECKR